MRIFVVLCILAVATGKKLFHGDQVLTLHPKNYRHVNIIKGLGDVEDLVDFWNPQYAEQVQPNQPVDIHVPKGNLELLKKLLRETEIDFEIKIEDLQILVDNQVKGRADTKNLAGYNYNVYHTFDEIFQWTLDIASEYPDKVSVSILGETYEGRDIPMLTITNNPNNPAILIDCGIHAREWISPAFCQCFVRNLLENYGSDPTLTAQLDQLTYYIIPVLNPDGYTFTWTDDRMWRKTRSNYGTACWGVDANRNFDAMWSGPGSSGNPCSITYYGPAVESEKEVKAISDFIRSHIGQITTYLAIHSYSQLFLYPYGYTTDLPATVEQLDKYAEDASMAIRNVYGTVFTCGTSAGTLAYASGGAKDFAYNAGVPLSYTVELRDTGTYGFLLPEDQIAPSCAETTEAMKVFANGALDVAYSKRK